MAPQDLIRQMRDIKEKGSDKKLAEKEARIKEAIIHKIEVLQRKMKRLEKHCSKLEHQAWECHDKGQKFKAWWCGVQLRRKKKKLKEVQRITPSKKDFS